MGSLLNCADYASVQIDPPFAGLTDPNTHIQSLGQRVDVAGVFLGFGYCVLRQSGILCGKASGNVIVNISGQKD